MRLSDKVIVGQLTDCDQLLFKAYGSFLRVEDKPSLQNSDFLLGWKNSAIFVNHSEHKYQGKLIQMDLDRWWQVARAAASRGRRAAGVARSLSERSREAPPSVW